MSFFRKLAKKSRQPSKQPTSLGIPTQIAVGALGISVDLDLGAGPGGETNARGSKIVLRDSSEVQRSRPSGSSTPIRDHEDGVASVHRIYEHNTPSDAPKGHSDYVIPDLSITGGERGVRDHEKHKSQETVAKQPPESFVEHGSKGYRFGEDAYQDTPGGNLEDNSNGSNKPIPQQDQAETAVLTNFRSAQGAEWCHSNRDSCLKGTRGNVLNEIELWTRDFSKSPIYWLNGLAGTGKTTITQTIAERTFADGQLGASFFCSRDFEDRSNLQLIFPTIAVQLSRKYSDFRSLFIPLVQSDPGAASESLYNQFRKLIVEPLRESGISTVIIIDALDECKDEQPTSAILSVLGRFVSEISKTKFLITGRPEPRIQRGFRLPLMAAVTDVFVLHEVDLHQVDNDISLLFTQKLTEVARRRRDLDGWPTKGQVDALCKQAAGLFVYAVIMVKFIDKHNDSPRKRLDFLLQTPKSSVDEGWTTIDSLYRLILQDAFGDEENLDNDTKFRLVLSAVILVTNPLSPSTIAVLLGFGVDEVFPLLSSVQSLLIFQGDIDSPAQPFHKSFPDFITDSHRCTNQGSTYLPPITTKSSWSAALT